MSLRDLLQIKSGDVSSDALYVFLVILLNIFVA